MKKISVVGAGFAGLTLSLRLAELGFEVDLYEKSSRVGGLLGTETNSFGLAEQAANALIRTARAEKLFADLQIPAVLPLVESKKRFIFRGIPKSWPLSVLETLSLVFKVAPKYIFSRQSLKPSPGETLKNWGLAKLGKNPTNFLLEPAMQGIYACESTNLSASLILGPLFNKNREKYSGLLTGPNGMQDLIDALEKALTARGVQIHLNSEIKLTHLRGPIVICSSASGAAAITRELYPPLSQTLARIRMASVVSVKVFFAQAQTRFKGFGCLIPRAGTSYKTLGVLMNSYIFAGRDKTYNETWILGGAQADQIVKMSDGELAQLIQSERAEFFKATDTALHVKVDRWDKALPAYDIELENILKQIDLPKGLYLHGNYLGGLGLSKILERGDRLAQELAEKYV
jgi:oxygen-dependent protoporphyrinogen oxidase